MASRLPLAAIVAALVAALLVAVPSSARSAELHGADTSPADTAAALSASYVSEEAATVYVARADDYADALAASPLAAAGDAPVLFVEGDEVGAATLAELERIAPAEVVILGGTAAVSEAVEAQLIEAGYSTRRIAGANRFETALDVAAELTGGECPSSFYFVEGENADDTLGWPDAVNAGVVAGVEGAPVLPVNAARYPTEIGEYVGTCPDAARIIVGGEAAVTPGTAEAIAGEDGEVTRVAGDTRVATSAATYAHGVNELAMTPATRVVIPGCSYVEGIAASAIAAANGWPTVMADCETAAASQPALDAIGGALDLLDEVIVVGPFSDEVTTAIDEATTLAPAEAPFCLRLLHHNDGESDVFPSSAGFGGMANMVTLANMQQEAPFADGCEDSGVVTVTSGDNFLAGPELAASQALPDDEPIYDALGLSLMNYDALDLGNHDFDFGPDFAARFITSFQGETPPPFLSANLDFSGEPSLQALVDSGRIAPSTVVEVGESQVGIIGLVTPGLAAISSPRDVEVLQDIVDITQGIVDGMTADGVDKVILISHLQGIGGDDGDLTFASQISGVDAIVAGGGDEVLADAGDPLIPGDTGEVFGGYPLLAEDADGTTVPVVTTSGNYSYLGRLELLFDAEGNLLEDRPFVEETSRMVRVATDAIGDGVPANEQVVEEVYGPIEAFVDDLGSTVIATSEVRLDGDRPAIRQQETNAGDLVADSQRWLGETNAAEFGLDPDAIFVGVQNGGGIRHDGEEIGPGDISVLDTFSMVPFSNFVSAFEEFTAGELKTLLERAYFDVEGVNGAFLHLSNLVVEVDLTQQAQEQDEDGNVVTEGERVVNLWIDDDPTDDDAGIPLVADGELVEGAPTFTMTIVDFSARGGDGYPLDDDFQVLGASYQQALQDYIEAPVEDGGLGGAITAADYPEDGEGRITITGLEG